ncbi:MAG: phosphatase PAP2 family protein [Planctomycetota bacterium]
MGSSIVTLTDKKKFLSLDMEVVYQNSVLITLFLVYTGMGSIFLWSKDLFQYADFTLYHILPFSIFCFLLFAKLLTYLVKNSIREGYCILKADRLFNDLKTNWLNANVIITVTVPFLLFPVLLSFFGSIKSSIQIINPYYLDQTLVSLDRFIHFGFNPWRLTHALFGSVAATKAIDFLYQLWFFVLMFYPLWMVLNYKLGVTRAKFLVCYVLTWTILGSVLAVIFSAVGPCFYEPIMGRSDVYEPLMSRLHEISEIYKSQGRFGLHAIKNQATLLGYFTDNSIGIGSGITAMPSMHVSFAMLLFLSARELNKKAGYLTLIYLFFIQVGSVHLGWHYAVDGYISMILTWILWRLSGWIVNRYQKSKAF